MISKNIQQKYQQCFIKLYFTSRSVAETLRCQAGLALHTWINEINGWRSANKDPQKKVQLNGNDSLSDSGRRDDRLIPSEQVAFCVKQYYVSSSVDGFRAPLWLVHHMYLLKTNDWLFLIVCDRLWTETAQFFDDLPFKINLLPRQFFMQFTMEVPRWRY